MILDKPYPLKFTNATLYKIHQHYGDLTAAFGQLTTKQIEGAVTFLSIALNKAPEEIMAYPQHLEGNMLAVTRALVNDLPRPEDIDSDTDGEAPGGYHWDIYYYQCRYKLNFSDKEFWQSTMYKAYRLLKLYNEANGLVEEDVELYTGELMW